MFTYLAGHTQVRMVAASIPGRQTPTGRVLTAVNIQGSPQKHTITQRAIAPHGISVQQSPQGTPMVIQVSTTPSQVKPMTAATAIRTATAGTLIAQPASNESLKTPLYAAPKVGQQMNVNQGTYSESLFEQPTPGIYLDTFMNIFFTLRSLLVLRSSFHRPSRHRTPTSSFKKENSGIIT